tara:strand:+ start:146 stop:868 length:723 start_codon:yes stop_codon:yes gene_type:complete
MSNYKLLGVGTNAKTIKGDGSEYLTAILYMTPYKVMVDGKHFNSCSMAEQASCIEGCLYTAGRGKFSNVQTARQRKAEWFYRDREGFMSQLYEDVTKFSNYCFKRGIQPCVRLNGTTDIRWERIKYSDGLNIFEHFSDVQFYDYTKIPNRKVADYPNYHLTWSYSSANPKYEELFWDVIRKGMSVAVVFRKPINMTTWRGYKVVDGDKDDLRFLDPQSSIVALYAKGAAKHDSTGFVQDI